MSQQGQKSQHNSFWNQGYPQQQHMYQSPPQNYHPPPPTYHPPQPNYHQQQHNYHPPPPQPQVNYASQHNYQPQHPNYSQPQAQHYGQPQHQHYGQPQHPNHNQSFLPSTNGYNYASQYSMNTQPPPYNVVHSQYKFKENNNNNIIGKQPNALFNEANANANINNNKNNNNKQNDSKYGVRPSLKSMKFDEKVQKSKNKKKYKRAPDQEYWNIQLLLCLIETGCVDNVDWTENEAEDIYPNYRCYCNGMQRSLRQIGNIYTHFNTQTHEKDIAAMMIAIKKDKDSVSKSEKNKYVITWKANRKTMRYSNLNLLTNNAFKNVINLKHCSLELQRLLNSETKSTINEISSLSCSNNSNIDTYKGSEDSRNIPSHDALNKIVNPQNNSNVLDNENDTDKAIANLSNMPAYDALNQMVNPENNCNLLQNANHNKSSIKSNTLLNKYSSVNINDIQKKTDKKSEPKTDKISEIYNKCMLKLIDPSFVADADFYQNFEQIRKEFIKKVDEEKRELKQIELEKSREISQIENENENKNGSNINDDLDIANITANM
eukprot:116722_1